MAIHANQVIHSPSIFQEIDNKNISDSSEYLHHSRARVVTNISRLQCYIENWDYGFLTFSLPWYFPSHYNNIQCHWQLYHSNSCPVGRKTVLRKNVQIPRKWNRFEPLLRATSKAEGRCQPSRCFSCQWKAISCSVMPTVLINLFLWFVTILTIQPLSLELWGDTQGWLKGTSTYNISTLPPGRLSAFIFNLTPISFLEMLVYWERQEIAGACSHSTC